MRSSIFTEQAKGAASSIPLETQAYALIEDFKAFLSVKLNIHTITLEDESEYVGQMRKNRKEGQGIFYASDRSIYFGEWLDDTYSGKGVYVYPDFERYEGGLVAGEKHGFGKYYYLNGDIYTGHWREGLKHGKGEQMYSFGQYQGDWVDNEREGEGTLHMRDQSGAEIIVQGTWLRDSFLEGHLESQSYKGSWRNGGYNGFGAYIHPDGSKYEGTWLDNQKHGKGCMRYINGDYYEGEFCKGLKHGRGVYRYASEHYAGTPAKTMQVCQRGLLRGQLRVQSEARGGQNGFRERGRVPGKVGKRRVPWPGTIRFQSAGSAGRVVCEWEIHEGDIRKGAALSSRNEPHNRHQGYPRSVEAGEIETQI